jgi:dipeptidyl aminopeptidase/acylaminoacyl peptidase
MKRLTTGLFLLILATTAFAQRPITFEDMAAVRRIGMPQLSPDGKWVAYDASSIDLAANVRRSAIYLVSVQGGDSRKLTDGTKQDEGPVWSPDGKTIAYVSNRDGSPKQVYLLDVATGQSRKLTSTAGGAGSVKWMPDGSGVVFVSDIYPDCGVDPTCTEQKNTAASSAPSKARVLDSLLFRHWNAWQEPTRAHVIFQPIGGGAARDLTPGAFDAPPFSLGGGDEFSVSPDSRELVYARNTEERPERSTNSDLFIVPLTGGEARRITTRTGADTSPSYSPDGRYIAYRSQSRNGYESDLWELWLYDRTAGTSRRVGSEFNDWIESVTWSPDSRSLFITAPLKGKSAIYEMTLDGRATLVNNDGGAGGVQVSRDGKTLVYELSTLERPAEIFTLARNGKPVRLTHDNDALLSQIRMGDASDTFWTGADGARIQAHLIKPPNFDPSKKYPAIVLIHGGPQGAWGDAWSYRWNPQIFAAKDYVILMPNPRGSSGFGQQFVEQISRDWGGRVYTDIMNGVDWLAAQPYVDASRMGAAGGSYGGYMVNWILGHSDRFKALVSHAGVYNLESMYGVTEEQWFPEWEFGGNPWDNPELYTKWSPHRFAKNFNTPTLVTHGELDYRVPIGEGFQLFTALQRKGVPSRMLYFPDEGHWVLKPQNSRLWFQTVGEWFDRWLKK